MGLVLLQGKNDFCAVFMFQHLIKRPHECEASSLARSVPATLACSPRFCRWEGPCVCLLKDIGSVADLCFELNCTL